jgi:CheY-like chemotaxis protein
VDARYRILVVDDHDDSARMLALALKLEGHTTRTARDGMGAFELIEAFKPEVVLLDLTLPDMTGQALARKIRSSPAGENLILISVSGSEPDAEATPLFDGFVLKPAELDRVLGMISAGQKRRAR